MSQGVVVRINRSVFKYILLICRFATDDIDLEEIFRVDNQYQQPRSVVHYMTQYIKQGTEEPIYYSLLY